MIFSDVVTVYSSYFSFFPFYLDFSYFFSIITSLPYGILFILLLLTTDLKSYYPRLYDGVCIGKFVFGFTNEYD